MHKVKYKVQKYTKKTFFWGSPLSFQQTFMSVVVCVLECGSKRRFGQKWRSTAGISSKFLDRKSSGECRTFLSAIKNRPFFRSKKFLKKFTIFPKAALPPALKKLASWNQPSKKSFQILPTLK